VSQLETVPGEIATTPPDWEDENEKPKQPPVEEFPAEPAPPKADLTQARLLLTEPRPAGFGEVLVTEVWSKAPPKPPPKPIATSPEIQEEEPPPPPDRQKQWETRQELRELGLLRERPMLSHDARYESYWGQARDTMAECKNAMVDPYTQLAAEFGDVDLMNLRDHSLAAREYGFEADSLLHLGRGAWVIGRHKGARAMLERAAKMEPLHPEIWYNLGVVRLFTRANAGARAALEEASDQMPGDFRAELALALACYHLRDYQAAADHFQRLTGPTGLRASARAMLACSLRMMGDWEGARVELSFLREARPGDWPALCDQCLDCVERGEQKLAGHMRKRRSTGQMWRALAAVGAGGLWLAYSLAENLFKHEAQWAILPLFGLVLYLVRSLRRISGRELSGEFGNAEQGLPCWQATTWLRPRQAEF
jgi:tetratricopeptide (TPR) repeat protein